MNKKWSWRKQIARFMSFMIIITSVQFNYALELTPSIPAQRDYIDSGIQQELAIVDASSVQVNDAENIDLMQNAIQDQLLFMPNLGHRN